MMSAPIPVEQQFTEEQKDKIISMHRNNATQEEIAKEFGVPRRTIMKLCNKLGLKRDASEISKLNMRSKLDNPETLKIIKEMREDNRTLEEIMGKVGGSISAINRICKKYNYGIKRTDYKAAAADYESGMSLKQVAQKYGVATQTIHSGLKRLSVKFRDPMLKFTGCKPREVKLDKNQLIIDYESYGSLSAVAEKHGCTLAYVRDVLESD